jgi:hypothetical protein
VFSTWKSNFLGPDRLQIARRQAEREERKREKCAGSADQFSPINAALLAARRTTQGQFLVKGLCKGWKGVG